MEPRPALNPCSPASAPGCDAGSRLLGDVPRLLGAAASDLVLWDTTLARLVTGTMVTHVPTCHVQETVLALCFFFVFCFLDLFFFRDRVSLCSPGCPETHSVDQAGLEPASASQVLGLQACATTAQLMPFYF